MGETSSPNSADCESEYSNAVTNGDLMSFYERCRNEQGDNPLRNRCSYCSVTTTPTAGTPSPTAGIFEFDNFSENLTAELEFENFTATPTTHTPENCHTAVEGEEC